jgi:hypothetical protein
VTVSDKNPSSDKTNQQQHDTGKTKWKKTKTKKQKENERKPKDSKLTTIMYGKDNNGIN